MCACLPAYEHVLDIIEGRKNKGSTLSYQVRQSELRQIVHQPWAEVSLVSLISAVHFQSGRIYFEVLAGENHSIFI